VTQTYHTIIVNLTQTALSFVFRQFCLLRLSFHSYLYMLCLLSASFYIAIFT